MIIHYAFSPDHKAMLLLKMQLCLPSIIYSASVLFILSSHLKKTNQTKTPETTPNPNQDNTKNPKTPLHNK